MVNCLQVKSSLTSPIGRHKTLVPVNTHSTIGISRLLGVPAPEIMMSLLTHQGTPNKSTRPPDLPQPYLTSETLLPNWI